MRGTLRVSSRTWHGRAYNFWRSHASFKTGNYRENLCHYVRVILFWAPISWFANGRISKRWTWLRPIHVVVSLALLTALVLGLVLRPANTLIFLGWCIGSLAAFTSLALFLTWLDDYDNQKKAGRFFHRVGRPFGKVFGPVGRLVGRAWSWFGVKSRIAELPRGAVTVLSGLTVLYIANLILHTSATLIATAFGLGGIAVLFGALWLGFKVYDTIKARRANQDHEPKDEGILKVGYRFVAAKKGRICPFIDVEG